MKSIRWEIEPSCNLNCKHCIVGKVDYTKRANLDKNYEIACLIKTLGFDHICFTTKEPFMNPDFLNLLTFCTNLKFKISLVTNGTLITEKTLDFLYSINIKEIAISLEGWTEQSNDYIRGKGVFNKVMTLLELIEKKNTVYGRKIDIIVQINLNKLNHTLYKEFISYFSKFTNLVIVIGMIAPLGNAQSYDLRISERFAEKFIMHLHSLIKDSFMNNIVYSYLSVFGVHYFNAIGILNQNPNVPSCGINKGAYSIYPDGEVIRCSMLDNKDCKISFQNHICDISEITEKELFINPKLEYEYKRISLCSQCLYKEQCNICYVFASSGMEKYYQEGCYYYKRKINLLIQQFKQFKYTLSLTRNCVLFDMYVIRWYDGISKKYKLTEEEKNLYSYLFKNKNVDYLDLINNCSKIDEKLLINSIYKDVLLFTKREESI